MGSDIAPLDLERLFEIYAEDGLEPPDSLLYKPETLPQDIIFHNYVAAGSVLSEYMDDWSPVSGVVGPLAGGKTFGSYNKLLRAGYYMPQDLTGVRRSKFFVVRNSYKQLMSISLPDWYAVLGGKRNADRLGKMRLTAPIYHKMEFVDHLGVEVDMEVHFFALDSPSQVDDFLGFQATGGLWQEMQAHKKEVFDVGSARVGRFPAHNDMPQLSDDPGEARYCAFNTFDTNSVDETHWLYDLAVTNPVEGYSIHIQPGAVIRDESGQWVLNPLAENLVNLRADYYPERLKGKSDSYIQCMLANEFVMLISGRPVHPEYVDQIHCPELNPVKYVPGVPVEIGADSSLNCAFACGQIINGGLQVFAELTCENTLADDAARQLRMMLALHGIAPEDVHMMWCDEAGASMSDNAESNNSTFINRFRKNGFPATKAPASNKQTALRRSSITSILTNVRFDHRRKYLVATECLMTRGALMGKWGYPERKFGGQVVYDTKPDKGPYSHIGEANEYLALGCGFGDGNTQNKPSYATPISTIRRAPRASTPLRIRR